jgi:hypothetical protein
MPVPVHPRCRCCIIPVIDEGDEPKEVPIKEEIKATTKAEKPKVKQTNERQKLQAEALKYMGDFAKSMNITEEEAQHRFEMLVDFNSDAQLRKFIKKYRKKKKGY